MSDISFRYPPVGRITCHAPRTESIRVREVPQKIGAREVELLARSISRTRVGLFLFRPEMSGGPCTIHFKQLLNQAEQTGVDIPPRFLEPYGGRVPLC
jgi:hypothetical protein